MSGSCGCNCTPRSRPSPAPRGFSMVSVRLRLIGMRGSVFRPEFFYWRLVLTLRKLCEVAVALMFSSKPLFQAWYVPHTRDSGSGAPVLCRRVRVGVGLGNAVDSVSFCAEGGG